MTDSAPTTTTTLTGLAALKWLSDHGARFCKVATWNDRGNAPGKRPIEGDWQNRPYTFEAIQQHIKAGGNVGMICGKYSGNLVLLDADIDFTEFLRCFPPLAHAPAVVRDGADKGKILIRITDSAPGGKKFKRDGDKHPFFEVLSTGNQGVIPPSKHTEGPLYTLINSDQEIPEYTPEELDDLCGVWAGGRLLFQDEPQAHGNYPVVVSPQANGDGLKEAVSAYWDCLKVFDHFHRASKTAVENNGKDLRLFGNGGLFIRVNNGAYDVWNIPGEAGTGGGIFQAWQYCKHGTSKAPTGTDFYNLLVEMAQEAGIPIPERNHKPAAAAPQSDTQGEQQSTGKRIVPDDDELAARYLQAGPLTAWGLGEWRRYSEGTWSVVEDDVIAQDVRHMLEGTRLEGVRITSARVNSVKELIRWRVVVPSDLWDSDPDIIVCQNGVLHIPTMQLRPHDPKYHQTFKVSYSYDPTARAEVWTYATTSTVPDAADFLQEFAGYSLTTDTRHELAVWLCGPAGSGKSTIIEGFLAMLGQRSTQLGLADIERSRFALGDIRGKTLAVASEQPAIYMQASHQLNKIISGEPVTTEKKFQDPITFTPRVKIIWAMNEIPRVPDAGNGIFRRVKVVKFPPLPESERSPEIKESIKTEGAGILNWAIEGLRRLRARGRFAPPACVLDATADFQKNNDVPALFVEECGLTGPDYRTAGQQLYDRYHTWCLETGHKPMSMTTLAEEWRRLGFEKKPINGKNYWMGIGLKTDDTAMV